MQTSQPEYWLRGPVAGISALLQPVAHALLQARDEIATAVKDLPAAALWSQPGGVASAGFHLQHLTGVIDRLFTYAQGRQLSEEQLHYLSAEGKEDKDITIDTLIAQLSSRIDTALEQLAATPESSLTETRGVGRKQVPSTVGGLLFHAAEHTMRHTGQLLVTIRWVTQG